MSKITSPIATISLAVAMLAIGSVSGRSAEPIIGHAYTLNNDGDSNAVVVLNRLADGTLSETAESPVPAGGKGLATSGADTVIIWPFASKDGPMGKEPAMLAPLKAKVTMVACHPKQDILACGYSDGTILMVRMTDGAEILVRANKGLPVSALALETR